jgi:hypothetical protein
MACVTTLRKPPCCQQVWLPPRAANECGYPPLLPANSDHPLLSRRSHVRGTSRTQPARHHTRAPVSAPTGGPLQGCLQAVCPAVVAVHRFQVVCTSTDVFQLPCRLVRSCGVSLPVTSGLGLELTPGDGGSALQALPQLQLRVACRGVRLVREMCGRGRMLLLLLEGGNFFSEPRQCGHLPEAARALQSTATALIHQRIRTPQCTGTKCYIST